MMPHCDSWKMVWDMQWETCQAAWSRLLLYRPGEAARRAEDVERNRERMLVLLREWQDSFDEPLDIPVEQS